MSHFYGSMQGARGEATRCGSKESGVTAHVRGWRIGARVQVFHENGQDKVAVHITGGSNSPSSTLYLGTYEENGCGQFVKK